MFIETTASGLDPIGPLPWGAHFCQFYRTRDDLVDSLVPYFTEGLARNEQCLWITADPLCAKDARAALKAAVPELDTLASRGQIAIFDHDEWYTRGDVTETESIVAGWLKYEERAVSSGFAGLRASGNTSWLKERDWPSFVEYESKLTDAFSGHRLVGLCCYSLGKCSAENVAEMVRNHQFTLLRRAGELEIIESSSLKIAKEELKRLNEELEDRVAARTAELAHALRMREEFLTMASHELKTPLTSLELYIDALVRAQQRREVPPEEVRGKLVKAQVQCRRLAAIVNMLLDVSRAAAGGLPLHLEKIDLAQVVQDVAGRWREPLARVGCALAVHADEPAVGSWDRLRLEAVLGNLLSNASRYAQGSPVEITLTRDREHATLVVRDRGRGIAPEDRERIFERFVQVSSEPRHGGFGLGLWIVRQVVRGLGGSIGLTSQLGEGCTFTIVLPFTPAAL